MQNNSKISIVVTYLPLSEEVDTMTIRCLDLIHDNTFNEHEVIVVSNGIARESFITGIKYDCDIIELPQNNGNAYAWDRGVSTAQSDIVILMDNDVFVEKDWDKDMIDRLSENGVGVTFPYSVLETDDYRSKQYRGRRDGFCFALKKETYSKAGPFLKDQPFHSYYEDDAFFAEVQLNLGLKLVACEGSKVFHKGQGTTKSIWNKEIEDGINKNKEWFENKYNKQYPYLTK